MRRTVGPQHVRMLMGSAKKQVTKNSIREVWFAERWRTYFLWGIVVVFAGLTIYDVQKIIVEYLEVPKITSMIMEMKDDMPLPILTFCMSKAHAFSKVTLRNLTDEERIKSIDADLANNLPTKELFLNGFWQPETLADAYDVISLLSLLEREQTVPKTASSISNFKKDEKHEEKRKSVVKWLKAIKQRSVTFEEFTQKVGSMFFKKEMGLIAKFVRDDHNEEKPDVHPRISWISQQYFCFQPIYDENDKTIKEQGQFFLLIVNNTINDVPIANLGHMSIDFTGRLSPLIDFIRGSGHSTDGFVDSLKTGESHEVTAEIKGHYTMLQNDEKETACTAENNEDNEFNCPSRCRLEIIKKMCDCIPATLSHLVEPDELKEHDICTYVNCEVNAQTFKETDQDCLDQCKPSCTQIRYESKQKVKGIPANETTISAHWGAFEYVSLEQSLKFDSFSSFVSALGGCIGIYLGLSVLSLLQTVGFVLNYFTLKTLVARESNTDADDPFAKQLNEKSDSMNKVFERQLNDRLENQTAH